ncbi:MAG: hypothetical protein GC164_11910 [Phycisphaera sp.]|nr:hypothetical protein [Phycisphaera sp.]
MLRTITIGVWAVALTLIAPSVAFSETASEPALSIKPEPSVYDQIWKNFTLYEDKEDPVIQSLKFTGRFQVDYAFVDAKQGQHDELNIRRFRLGAKATLFQHFTLHAEVDLNPQETNPLYQKITDCYVAWSESEVFVVMVGKQSAGFTLEGMTSSKELLTIDRSNLANNLWFPEEYFPGVTVSGKPGQWIYKAGIFSAGKANPEFGNFDGSIFALVTLGYDFAQDLGVKGAVLTINYVYNDPDPDNSVSRQLEQVCSINFNLNTESWGLLLDLSGGDGYGKQSDLWGVVVMPYHNFTDKIQGVVRYTYVTSDMANGVRLARYDSQLVSGKGDEYQEIYLGVNYYIYKHKLKVQTGVQYATMHDRAADGGKYSGFGLTVGLRIAW